MFSGLAYYLPCSKTSRALVRSEKLFALAPALRRKILSVAQARAQLILSLNTLTFGPYSTLHDLIWLYTVMRMFWDKVFGIFSRYLAHLEKNFLSMK